MPKLTLKNRVRSIGPVGPLGRHLVAGLGNPLLRWTVAATATLLTLAGCSGGGAQSSPQAAAQAWADAGLHHDLKARKALTCAAGANGEQMLQAVTAAIVSYQAGPARPDSPTSWTVPMQVEQVGGDTISWSFRVVREHDKYLVC